MSHINILSDESSPVHSFYKFLNQITGLFSFKWLLGEHPFCHIGGSVQIQISSQEEMKWNIHQKSHGQGSTIGPHEDNSPHIDELDIGEFKDEKKIWQ